MIDTLGDKYREILWANDDFIEAKGLVEREFQKSYTSMKNAMENNAFEFVPTREQTKDVLFVVLNDRSVRESVEDLYDKSTHKDHAYDILKAVTFRSLLEVGMIYARAHSSDPIYSSSAQIILNLDVDDLNSLGNRIRYHIKSDLSAMRDSIREVTLDFNSDYE